jgi:Na+-transporting methylmalonyl-CoA/oxaloacetate decarboxylase gamma subunit
MQHRQGVQRVIINGLFMAERFVLREEMEADETQNKVPVTSTKYKRLQTAILLHATHHSEHNTACYM